METGEHHRLLTYDIKDLYVNIPIQETLKITEQLLRKENNTTPTPPNKSKPYSKPYLNRTTLNSKTTSTNQTKVSLWDPPSRA
jgi:hypothetical protein